MLADSDSVPTSYYGMHVEKPASPEYPSTSIDFKTGNFSSLGWVSENDEALLSTWPEDLLISKPAIDMFPIDPGAVPELNWVGSALGFAPYPIKDFKRNNLDSVRPFTTARWAGTKKKNSSGDVLTYFLFSVYFSRI